MKKCVKCNFEYTTKICPECNRKNKRTVKGLLSKMYGSQIACSKKRGMNTPSYSKSELYEWLIKNDFKTLYRNWVLSGYRSKKIPSVDRIDDTKSYTIDNIQLVTWEYNKEKMHKQRIVGEINIKNIKTVEQYSLNGDFIQEFHSQKEAERVTGISQSSIGMCCNKVWKQTKGFKFKYK